MDLHALDDRALMTAAHAGRPEAFGELYRRHREVVLAYLVRRTRDRELAADLLAETFAAALLALRSRPGRRWEAPDHPLAWLVTVAHNKLVDTIRRGAVEQRARRRIALPRLAVDDADLQRIDELAASVDVAAVLARDLPAEHWEAVRLHVLADRTYAQIAADQRCSEALARQRVSRGLRRLRRQLEGEGS